MEKIKLFEMFAGYGGASFALKKAGVDYETVGYSEIDKFAIQCYEQNHGNVKNYGDCTKINVNELPDFDLLTGGFPCQAFSNAGKMQGELDTRGTLVYDIIRIAEVKQPKYLLLENVKGFTFKKFKETFNKVLSELDRIGYNVYWEVLNSKEYGTPQNRERVWFVCFRKDIDQYDKLTNPFRFPKKEELKLFLKDILEDNPDYKYNLTESNIKTINRDFGSKGKVIDMSQDLSIIEKMTYPKRINQTQGTLSPTLTTVMGTGGGNVPVIQMTKSGYETNDSKPEIGQANRVYGTNGISPPLNVSWTPKISEKMLNKKINIFDDDISSTLTTELSHGTGRDFFRGKQWEKIYKASGVLRRLTPKECFRLMGFFEDEINLAGLSDTQKYKLAGNGWDINLVSQIFTQMFKKCE